MTTRTKTPKKITPVMLAKDVLKLLDAKKLVAVAGDYVALPESVSRANDDAFWEDSIDTQTFLKRRGVKCEVCALGAAFCAYVYRVDGTHRRWDHQKLGEVLSDEQMDLMEAAFERNPDLTPWGSERLDYGMLAAAVEFGERYKKDVVRLRAIMRNIIANGKFKPEVKAKAR